MRLPYVTFSNIINEWYARDTSRKITSHYRAKGNEGKRLTTSPIYGYVYDEKKENWIIDEETAQVVKRIFNLTIEGHGVCTIARMLTDEKVIRPGYYQVLLRNGRGNEVSRNESEKYTWTGTTVIEILSKPEYRGATVNFRFSKKSYKDKNHTPNPKDKWLVFEDTHPEIIDTETWETAQKCRKTVKRTDTFGQANPLTGKLFCADCGAKMYNHRKAGGKPNYKNETTGKIYMRSPTDQSTDQYVCSKNTNAKAKFKKECTTHHIKTAAVRQLILDTIKAATAQVESGEAEFIKQIRETSAIQQEETAKAYKRNLMKTEKRVAELNTLIRKIYEDNVNGKLTDKRFELLSAEYEAEQEELEKTITETQTAIDSFAADSMRADKFIQLTKRYKDFTELTTPMINEFIDRILVHESKKIDGERFQEVDIYFNFIGKFELPPQELTEEEKRQQEKIKRRRESQRRYNARKRKKQKQKKAAEEQEQQQTKPAEPEKKKSA